MKNEHTNGVTLMSLSHGRVAKLLRSEIRRCVCVCARERSRAIEYTRNVGKHEGGEHKSYERSQHCLHGCRLERLMISRKGT